MSLKVFHVVFMLASIVLSTWFGFWAIEEGGMAISTIYSIFGVASLSIAGFLVIYLVRFLQKSRGYGFLSLGSLVALGLSVPNWAWACAVCWGNPDAPLTKAANAGVLFLLIVVSVLLSAFLSLFLYWAKRARNLQ